MACVDGIFGKCGNGGEEERVVTDVYAHNSSSKSRETLIQLSARI